MPDRTLYLKKDYDIACYTRMPVAQIDVKNYVDGSVVNWLKEKEKECLLKRSDLF